MSPASVAREVAGVPNRGAARWPTLYYYMTRSSIIFTRDATSHVCVLFK